MDANDTKNTLELLGSAIRSRKVAIITHNNPDPDSIAAALGLSTLLKKRFNKDSALFYGGLIGRAENRAMIRELNIKMKNIREFDHRVYRTTALVDTQPGAGNNSLNKDIIPDIVIDHHIPVRKKTHLVPFHDIRADFGSTSTIIFEYLKEAGIEITSKVATALFYGIKTDTYDLGREFIKHDIDAYFHCAQRMNRKILHSIERPLHRQSYFVRMYEAIDETEICGDLLFTVVRNADYPEITAEVADWLYTMRGIKWTLVVAVDASGEIFLSIRTRDKKRDAGHVITKIAGPHGMAGGHGLIAGGSIRLDNPDPVSVRKEIMNVKAKFFKLLSKNKNAEPAPLINRLERPLSD